MKVFVSKPNEWFDEGTIAIPITEPFGDAPYCAIFVGTKNGKLDEETCCLEEFKIIERYYWTKEFNGLED